MPASWMIRLYSLLPPLLRDSVAGYRGATLRSWRYGLETDALVEEALERDQWTSHQWSEWQAERLDCILHRARTQVPWYRDYWDRSRAGEKAWKRLENWPLLDKEVLRSHPRALLADDCNPASMFEEHSSGSTGKPVTLWQSRDTLRRWYALFEARWRRWHGVNRNDPWAILGGQLVTPVVQRNPPYWVWNAPMRQLYLSSYHLFPDAVPYYLDALRQRNIVYLLGYTSALYALAQGALHADRSGLNIRVTLANAEPVYPHQREVIEKAFGCPLRETYGMSEMVMAAGECGEGSLHLWPDVGLEEVLEGGQSISRGVIGEFICTGLHNMDMPLIRYRVGDRGTLTPVAETACACGRTLPRLTQVEGRTDDVLYMPDGRPVGRLDPVFKGNLPVRESQIRQESRTRFVIRVVPAKGYTPQHTLELAERLRERVGQAEVKVETWDAIPRSANGKLRAVVCLLSAEEKADLGEVSIL